MAKVVIAGRAECPYFARVELLGDKLTKNLPNFQLYKIVKTDDDWEGWLNETCSSRGWNHSKSPIVWRELIDRGGKGVLIGGANEFQEYVMGYYGIVSDLNSLDMKQVAMENKTAKTELDEEEQNFKDRSKPLQVCVTNASNPVCYNLVSMIASGDIFGSSMEVSIRLLDSEDKEEFLSGLVMEAQDLAYGPLRGIQVYSDTKKAFSGSSVIILLDEVSMDENESNESWLKRNVEYFKNLASIMNEVASKNVKVLLTGLGPLNLNASVMIKNATQISRQNIVALSRMVENHAKSVVGSRLSVNSAGVVDLIVWGNVNSKNFIDVSKSRVHGYDGAIWGPASFSVSAKEMIHDDKWLDKEFLELVASRKNHVEESLKHPASMAQANAIGTFLNHWTNGSPKGQIFSLAVASEGWYGVPEGMVFSFPVIMHPKGYYNIIQDIDLSDQAKQTLQDAIEDLKREQDAVNAPAVTTVPETQVTDKTEDSKETEAYTEEVKTEIAKDETNENAGEKNETVGEDIKETSESEEKTTGEEEAQQEEDKVKVEAEAEQQEGIEGNAEGSTNPDDKDEK